MSSSPPPPTQEEAQEKPQPVPQAQNTARSIYSYWGKTDQAGPSQPPPPTTAPKRKRKKVEDGPPQARLALSSGGDNGSASGSSTGNGNGNGWALGRAEVEPADVKKATGRGKGKGKAELTAGGEDEEMKEMVKRAKQLAKKVPKSPVRKKNAAEAAADTLDEVDRAIGGPDGRTVSGGSSFLGDPSSPAQSAGSHDPLDSIDRKGDFVPKPRLSPSKRRKPVRPLKPKSSLISLHPPSSPEVVDLVSSDPVHPSSSQENTLAPRSAHPFFGRTNSSSSKGAFHDPIDVEQEAPRPPKHPGPRKVVFAADKKVAHPLFARVAAGAGAGTGEIDGSRSGSVISDTAPSEATVKSTNATVPSSSGHAGRATANKTFSLFSLNGGGQDMPGKLKTGWGRGIKEGKEWDAPWLVAAHNDENQDGPLAGPGPSSWSTRTLNLARRQRPHPDNASSVVDSAWTTLLQNGERYAESGRSPRRKGPTNLDAQQNIPFVEKHPALASVRSKNGLANRETWCDRYRPLKSSQILGNELEAEYLRDWLRTLSVKGGTDQSGQPSRKIIRKVKRAKSHLVEGWIVDDAGLFGDPHEDDTDEELEDYADYFEPNLALGQRPDEYPPLDSARLTNTILLTGPSGSGKSAAIYAAASELDWEVFEVYPGMGRRTGGNLMSWVGDVGRNHLVVKGGKGDHEERGEGERGKGGIKSFFGNGGKLKVNGVKDAETMPASQGSATEPIEVDQVDDEEEEAQKGEIEEGHLGEIEVAQPKGGVRQSLILIDEADILFAEENTFWPTVISLIGESRRPVILTCNDHTRIPREQLPLQTILHFRPPPSWLAVPYLEAIARKEGTGTDEGPSYVHELYHRSLHRCPPELLEGPLPPNGNEPLPFLDLRHAITQMQLDREREGGSGDTNTSVGKDLSITAEKPITSTHNGLLVAEGELNTSMSPIIISNAPDVATAWKNLDNQSWADAFVAPRSWAIMEIAEIDRHSPTLDDELGLNALLKPDIHDLLPTLAAYDRAPEIATEIVRLAGGRTHVEDLGDLQTQRIHYVRSLLPLLDPLIPLTAPLLPAPSLFLDVLPALQTMVQVDDFYEMAEEAAVARGESRMDRKTGRPKRSTRGVEERYERYIDVEEAGLKVARRSLLRESRPIQ